MAGVPEELLSGAKNYLDNALYAQAGALQDFGADFAAELLGLHITGEVVQHDEADGLL